MSQRAPTVATGLLIIPTLAGVACDDTAPQLATTPTSVQPAATVSFAETDAHISEGEDLAIGVLYDVRELADPVRLRIEAREVTADADDYRIAEPAVTLPALGEKTGTVQVALSALMDARIAEGDETLELHLLPPPQPLVALGPSLAVTIADAAASPCEGITTSALPIVTVPGEDWIQTTLTLTFERSTADHTWLELLGPLDRVSVDLAPMLSLNVMDWRIGRPAGSLRHSLDIEWPASGAARFGFHAGTPDPCHEAQLFCSEEGCEVIP